MSHGKRGPSFIGVPTAAKHITALTMLPRTLVLLASFAALPSLITSVRFHQPIDLTNDEWNVTESSIKIDSKIENSEENFSALLVEATSVRSINASHRQMRILHSTSSRSILRCAFRSPMPLQPVDWLGRLDQCHNKDYALIEIDRETTEPNRALVYIPGLGCDDEGRLNTVVTQQFSVISLRRC